MSLPDEYIRAQERIILYFTEDKLDRKLWPKHLMNGAEMKITSTKARVRNCGAQE